MSVELPLYVCHIKQLKYKRHVSHMPDTKWSIYERWNSHNHYSIYALTGFEMQGSLPVHSHHLFNWNWTEKLKGLNGEEALYSSWVAKKKPGLVFFFFFFSYFLWRPTHFTTRGSFIHNTSAQMCSRRCWSCDILSVLHDNHFKV